MGEPYTSCIVVVAVACMTLRLLLLANFSVSLFVADAGDRMFCVPLKEVILCHP